MASLARVSLRVKWQRQAFEVDVALDRPVLVLKAQVESRSPRCHVARASSCASSSHRDTRAHVGSLRSGRVCHLAGKR